MSDLDVNAILARSEKAQTWISAESPDFLPLSLREHFNYDVPALIGAVKRLTAELDAVGVIEHEGRRLRVITRALHDRLCTVRVATPQEGTNPEVLHCHFCGFCYPRQQQEGGTAR